MKDTLHKKEPQKQRIYSITDKLHGINTGTIALKLQKTIEYVKVH